MDNVIGFGRRIQKATNENTEKCHSIKIEHGLTDSEVQESIKAYGTNKLTEKKKKSIIFS